MTAKENRLRFCHFTGRAEPGADLTLSRPVNPGVVNNRSQERGNKCPGGGSQARGIANTCTRLTAKGSAEAKAGGGENRKAAGGNGQGETTDHAEYTDWEKGGDFYHGDSGGAGKTKAISAANASLQLRGQGHGQTSKFQPPSTRETSSLKPQTAPSQVAGAVRSPARAVH